MLTDVSLRLQQAENGRRPHSGFFDFRAQSVRDGTGDIFKETAAGDMADTPDIGSVQRRKHRLDVNFRRRQQGVPQRLAQLRDRPAKVGMLHIEYPADQ